MCACECLCYACMVGVSGCVCGGGGGGRGAQNVITVGLRFQAIACFCSLSLESVDANRLHIIQ